MIRDVYFPCCGIDTEIDWDYEMVITCPSCGIKHNIDCDEDDEGTLSFWIIKEKESI